VGPMANLDAVKKIEISLSPFRNYSLLFSQWHVYYTYHTVPFPFMYVDI
jgi:hypothetical protein